MSESTENPNVTPGKEQSTGSKWLAILVLLFALLLLCGGVGAVLILNGGREDGGPVHVASLGDPVRGRQVVLKYGCVQCHTDDGTRAMGPSFKGLFGSTQTYIDGSTGLIDEADVRLALKEPNAKVIDTFDAGQMRPFPDMPEEEIVNLLAYLRSIGLKGSQAKY